MSSNQGTSNWDTEQATALLKQRLRRHVWELCVLIQEGEVTLRGFAVTYYGKQLAQHAALEVIGLPIRANEIEVKGARRVPEVNDEG